MRENRGVGDGLQVRIQCRVDPQSGLVDLHSVAVNEYAAHPFHEVGRRYSIPSVGADHQRIGASRFFFLGCDHALPGHQRQHHVASRHRPLRIQNRVVATRRHRHGRQGRRLREVEATGVLAEIALCRVLYSVYTVEIDLVEIRLHDLGLRIGLFQGAGHPHLPQLAPHRNVLTVHDGGEHVPGELLGDRAAPGGFVTRERELDHRLGGPPVVDAVVRPEALVLDGHERLDHVPWDLLVLDGRTPLFRELVQQGAVGRVHPRGLLGLECVDLSDRGTFIADVGPGSPRHATRQREPAEDDGQPDPAPPRTGPPEPKSLVACALRRYLCCALPCDPMVHGATSTNVDGECFFRWTSS